MSFEFYYTVSGDDIREYMPDVPVLLPASSFVEQRRNGEYYLRKPNLPEHIHQRAADCGGFVASFKWGGVYRYSPEQYIDWLHTWKPQWSAMMDFCCEDEITNGRPGIVRDRQQATTGMAYRFWDDYRDAPWVWVPTIQGWYVKDYRRHAREMKPLIDEMRAHYGPASVFRVGIGTLCKRASAEMIRQVVSAVVAELGDVPLHLWGIKLGYLQSGEAMPSQIVSVDSAAWNDRRGRGIEAYRHSGLTQRKHAWTIAQPVYEQKVKKALSTPKQQLLFFSIESEEVV
jgi:hypothetical protein